MAARIPSSLKWLIDKRARLDGEVQKMEAAASRARTLVKELSTLKKDLEAIDRAFRLHHIQVETELISPIRSHQGRISLPQGEFTRLILKYLREAGDTTISTHELAVFVSGRLTALGGQDMDMTLLTKRIRYRLKNLAKDGIVRRHHPQKCGKIGEWSLAPST